MIGSFLGCLTRSSVLVVVGVRLRLGVLLHWILRRFSGATVSDIHLFVADVIKSFDTVDRGVLDRVLGSLGLPDWFRYVYFEYPAHVRLRFKLAAGLGERWTRDGRLPLGCPLSMMFIVALCLPCRYPSAQEGLSLCCMLIILSVSLGTLLCYCVLLGSLLVMVGQEPAPSKCLLLSISKAVRKDLKDWVLPQEGDKWPVTFDVRDLGGHLDTTFRGWSATLASSVRLVIARLVLIFALLLEFHGGVRVVRSMYLPAALYGIEASLLASDSLRKLRSSTHRVVWSRRQPLASVGAVLSLMDGPTGCDPAFCVVWFRFRLLRRYLALWPSQIGRAYSLLEMVGEGGPGHGPIHLLTAGAAEIGFRWGHLALGWSRPCLLLLSNVAGLFSISRLLFLMLGGNKVARSGPLLDVHGTLQLLNSSHVRERDEALLRSVMLGGVWHGFFLVGGRVRGQPVPCRFCVALDSDGHLFFFWENVPFLLLLRFVKILNFMVSWEWIRLIGPGVRSGMAGTLRFLGLMVPLLGLLMLLRLLSIWLRLLLGDTLLG